MSQKEKEIAKKGYLLGQAELMVRQKSQKGGEEVGKADSGTESTG